MGYDPITGVWIGSCTHAEWIDQESCCLTLNIVPILFTLAFLCIILGCSSYLWGTFYLASGCALFVWIVWVAIMSFHQA